MAATRHTTGAGRGLATFAGAAVAGTAVLGLAQAAISKFDLRPLANVALVLLVGLVGFLAQRLTALAANRQDQQKREQATDEALVCWPAPAASEVDIFDLGVYPPVSGRRDPPYVGRDIDEKLAEALAAACVALVVGPARSGKSRTALEVLREARGDALVFVPESAVRLGELISAAPEQEPGARGAVLWLDGLERFLKDMRINALETLTGPGARLQVLATIDEAEMDRLLAAGGEEAHTLRRFIARSASFQLPAPLTHDELARAQAVADYAGLDFSNGFASAFAGEWAQPITLAKQMPAPSPAPPPPRSREWLARLIDRARSWRPSTDALARWRRTVDSWAIVIVLLIAMVLGWTTKIAFAEGLVVPPPIAVQLADLHHKLSSCGIEPLSSSNAKAIEEDEPFLVATDPMMTCAVRASSEQPILIYSVNHGRLEQVGAFGPPTELLPNHFRFECRGTDRSDPCWTDITDEQGLTVIGGFRSFSGSNAIFPVAVRRVAGKFEARPLLSEQLPLTNAFTAAVYAQPAELVQSNLPGYYVADFALVGKPSGDQNIRAVRFVAGFTPVHKPGARRALEIRTRVLGLNEERAVLGQAHCVPVDPGDLGTVTVPTGRSFQVQLEESWKSLEQRPPVGAVCY
jgi:hypothetical protein